MTNGTMDHKKGRIITMKEDLNALELSRWESQQMMDEMNNTPGTCNISCAIDSIDQAMKLHQGHFIEPKPMSDDTQLNMMKHMISARKCIEECK